MIILSRLVRKGRGSSGIFLVSSQPGINYMDDPLIHKSTKNVGYAKFHFDLFSNFWYQEIFRNLQTKKEESNLAFAIRFFNPLTCMKNLSYKVYLCFQLIPNVMEKVLFPCCPRIWRSLNQLLHFQQALF